MAATYLGVAQSALEATGQHLKTRKHSYFEEPLANVATLQNPYGEMWLSVVKTRSLIRKAASLADQGDPDALPYLFEIGRASCRERGPRPPVAVPAWEPTARRR